MSEDEIGRAAMERAWREYCEPHVEANDIDYMLLIGGWMKDAFMAGYEAREAEVERLTAMLDGLERLQGENKEVVGRVQGAGSMAITAAHGAVQEMTAAVKRAEAAEAEVAALTAQVAALEGERAELRGAVEALLREADAWGWDGSDYANLLPKRWAERLRLALATDPARGAKG